MIELVPSTHMPLPQGIRNEEEFRRTEAAVVELFNRQTEEWKKQAHLSQIEAVDHLRKELRVCRKTTPGKPISARKRWIEAVFLHLLSNR
jgi:antitoxin component HigA of HigAB toxin-antitoxin module